MCHATDYEHLQPEAERGSGIPADARAGASPDALWAAAPFAMVEKTGRYRPCERCGGTPAVHNPHPLNPAFVGHEYV
jgi:hypothetical protein